MLPSFLNAPTTTPFTDIHTPQRLLDVASARSDSPARQILAEFHPAGPAPHGLDRLRRIRAATLQKPFVFHAAKLVTFKKKHKKRLTKRPAFTIFKTDD